MSDSSSIRIRLIALSVAIVGIAGLVAWAAKTSWDLFEALRQRMREEKLGSFRIADEFQANIYRLNYTLIRFGTRETSAELERFRRESQELYTWLEQQKTLATTPREPVRWAQSPKAFPRRYLHRVRAVISQVRHR
jgi:hypothetical protein